VSARDYAEPEDPRGTLAATAELQKETSTLPAGLISLTIKKDLHHHAPRRRRGLAATGIAADSTWRALRCRRVPGRTEARSKRCGLPHQHWRSSSRGLQLTRVRRRVSITKTAEQPIFTRW
jgi:hypothetical protein